MSAVPSTRPASSQADRSPRSLAATLKQIIAVRRLGYVYIPMGMNAAAWTPATEGALELSPSLLALTPVVDHVTVLTGLVLAYLYGEEKSLLLNDPSNRLIGIGMWLALIMAFNVWFIIWPNQKKALGLVEADDATKAKAARTAMLTSRINVLLSIPMLLAMTNYR